MSYRANNGRAFFQPEKEIKDGVWTSNTSYNPLWGVRGEDGSPSWAVDRRIFLLDLPFHKVHTIVKINKRTGEIFTVSYADFQKYGKEGNWGHGDQIALPHCYWTITQGKKKRQPREPRQPGEPKIKMQKSWVQQTLFGG